MGKISDLVGEQSKLSEYAVTIDKILSWIVAIAGLILAVWTSVAGDQINFPWILGIIAVDSIMLVLLGVLSAVLFAKQRASFRDKQVEVEVKLKNEIKLREDNEVKSKNDLTEKDKAIETGINKYSDFISGGATLTRAAIESTNGIAEVANRHFERIRRLEPILDEAEIDRLNQTDNSKEDGIYAYFLDEYLRSLEQMSEDFFQEHDILLKQLLDTGSKLIEDYLSCRGMPLRVSMCVKLFVDPNFSNELLSQISRRNIYTAFRDTETFDQERRRENPPQRFSVKGNSDFEHCLATDSVYTFNNAVLGGTVRNESNHFCRLYNCGATAEIVSKVKGSREPGIIYGFIACDVLNQDGSLEPIDDHVGDILIMLRNLLALFYDQIDAVWGYAFDSSEELCASEESASECGQTFFDAYYAHLTKGELVG